MVALVLEGVVIERACESLGIAPGTFESHKQAIRRKLAVPRGQRLEVFLRQNVGAIPLPGGAVVSPKPEVVDESVQERRIRWLLRITLAELSEVAGSAALRAELLEQTVRRMGSDEPGEAEREIAELQFVARELNEAYRRLLEQVRSGEAAAAVP